MEKNAPREQVTDLSLVGLEKVFVQIEQSLATEQIATDSNIHEQNHEYDGESTELVSMAEASRRLKMPYPTLRRQVLSGKIASVPGADGKPLVKLTCIEQSANIHEAKLNKAEQSSPQSDYSETIQRLLQQMEAERTYSKALNEKLEAANHRNGYLEAKVDHQGEQIKLLTDTQHRAGLWTRFYSWMVGTNK
ncbi:MAG: hypothetical protein WCT03_09515 [Candidatus Obscuribacterales bacterium]|jgi:hypothetical protein